MIVFDHVTITYPGARQPTLSDVNLTIPEGELVLVVGRTGSGKSTLLRAINGLVPHFTGGTLAGRVVVAGRDTSTHPPRELADVVGVVPQDPMSAFVTDTVEDELAYGMECLGLPTEVMRRRVEETLDLLGLADIRQRPLRSLSGGQRQRVAIGAVLTSHPRVLVLDEPTSALDPGAAEEVLAALQRLVHDLGVTVVLAEHRLERVVQYADLVVVVPGDGHPVRVGRPRDIMLSAPIAPPVVELGRMAGWRPLPLSVRDARRAAGPLRRLLADRTPHLRAVPASDRRLMTAEDVTVRYANAVALRGVSLTVSAGEVVALMGRNGAGKSTLLNAMVGIGPRAAGTVRVDGHDPATLAGPALLRSVGLVPQEPGDLLESSAVTDECRASDRDAGCDPGTTRALLALMAPEIEDGSHPRDLSEGQRLLLALCVVLAARPPLLLLDEPTRGLDYPTKARLARVLDDLADDGHAIVLATHDVELVADVADRVVIIADGEIVADGPTLDVVTSSPMFAPQVVKILSPQHWLTVDQVASALFRAHAPIDAGIGAIATGPATGEVAG
jgi:energy-coupling factor transporter ATP-binding protein EcfA2